MEKKYIMVDIETNGPIPGDYSMTSLGATVVDKELDKSFGVNIKPISQKFDPDRVKFVDSENAVDAKKAMSMFKEWLEEVDNEKLVFVSDNNGFDWMFVCWYFWHFLNENPFGYYSENMQSLYRGLTKNMKSKIADIRETELLHKAEDDAKDNAKIFLSIQKRLS